VAAGLPVTTAVPEPAGGHVTPRPGSMPVLDADGARTLAGTGALLDARAPQRYRGEIEPLDPRAGHIPGARNAPFAEHVGADGRWRAPADLAGHYRGLGAGSAEVGAYCGSGVTAASVVLALEHAGLRPSESPAALYVGSWSNWCADPVRPVALGADPGDPGTGPVNAYGVRS
ncbi:MAG TPA: rhodanese-like domain-containing protein, partial [Pseudonocardia sp.]